MFMKKFKKIYIEITNSCNLNCSFCSANNRKKEFISTSNFETILKKINNYTDYVYLHVLGEPLLHPNFKKILELCKKYNKKVNITTNGTLLKEQTKNIIDCDIVRQINISLHSENHKKNYLDDIFKSVNSLSKEISIVYRFWTLDNNTLNQKDKDTINYIINYYKLDNSLKNKIYNDNNIKISNNIYINKSNKFVWPTLNNSYCNKSGYCHSLKDHIAILVDGTIIPCCLDGEGVIKLGNIYNNNLIDIISSNRFQNMMKGFQNRKVTEELCIHCSFKNRF